MQKTFNVNKAAAVLSYIAAAVLAALYAAAEFIPKLYLSTGGRLLFLCGCCVCCWFGGMLLTKEAKSNLPMKINLKIYLALFLLLFVTLTLFDPLWGRSGNAGLWNGELFDEYIKNSLNLVPFRTIFEYFTKNDLRQFTVNILGNIVCLMPLGILLPLIWEKQKKPKTFLLTCAATVSAVEILQFITFAGSCDIDDLILNVFGAEIIYFAAKTKKINKILRYVFLLEK